jgi:hypothetical protein
VTVHHAAGTAIGGVDTVFNRAGSSASTHYGVKDKIIHQYLLESDTPWSDSNWASNTSTISFEMCDDAVGGDWPMSEATFDSAAELVADILRRYGLGRAIKGQTVCWHQMYAATACPGPYMLRRMDDFCALVNRKLEGGSVSTIAKRVQMYPPNLTAAQLWKPIRNADGSYTFESKALPGHVLDVKGGTLKSGVPIQAYKKNGTDAQKFKVVRIKGTPDWAAPFEVVPMTKGLRLDVKGASSAPKTDLQLYKANSSNAQRFQLLNQGNGYWAIICVGTGTCIDLANAGK